MIHVACVAEGDYVAHSAAMLHSLLETSGPVAVHYLHGPEMDRSRLDRLAAMVERDGGSIAFVEVPDARCEGLPTEGFTRKATWYRIFLPELLADLDRVLFLDADLLVLDPLEPLWETDVGDHYLAAVSNVFQDDHLHRPAQLRMDDPEEYFNAGVMLMNLDVMRRDGCVEALRAYGVEHADGLMFRDQDALNAVLGSRRVRLHPRWNLMNSVINFPWSRYVFGAQAVEEARRRPAIRHFEGPTINKPWHVLCNGSLRDLYFEHRRATPWPRVELEGVTLANRARLLKRRLRP